MRRLYGLRLFWAYDLLEAGDCDDEGVRLAYGLLAHAGAAGGEHCPICGMLFVLEQTEPPHVVAQLKRQDDGRIVSNFLICEDCAGPGDLSDVKDNVLDWIRGVDPEAREVQWSMRI